MGKKLFKLVIIILMIFGIIQGLIITAKRLFPDISLKKVEENIVSKMQKNNAELLELYTYGRSLNLKGRLSGVSDDNIESVKLYLTDGLEYERTYSLEYKVEDHKLIFETRTEINNGLILDKLEEGKQYYLLLRLKLNNSINARYFSFDNTGNCEEINYYSISKLDENDKLVSVKFIEKNINSNNFKFVLLSAEKTELPEEVYDIVIDAGHGGKDSGVKKGSYTEAGLALDYANSLKEKLENEGFKVKLTRDEENNDSFTSTNMYDENGRISIACKTKAKLMISLHVNNGANNLSGFEIYCPPNSNLNLAKKMAEDIKEKSAIDYSNGNNYKESDGVYVRNYKKSEISDMKKTAEKNGYEPYDISENTSYLYTIREVGSFGTGAYVDGRNKAYSKNEYYRSQYGIECYQIELGYIKNDLDILINEKDLILEGITKAVTEFYN